MGSYNEVFRLNTRDIALIKQAVREQIGVISRAQRLATVLGIRNEDHDTEKKIRELHGLLGKLHNQKVWYGQAHHTGVPFG